MQPAPSGQEDETDQQAARDPHRGNEGIPTGIEGGPSRKSSHSLPMFYICKAKQAPEEKPAGVSQETLAIITIGLAAITLGYMVGACGVIDGVGCGRS